MKEDENKLKDMDEFLKLQLVDFWFKAINLRVMGEWKKTFIAFKSVFNMIQPYNFNSKSTTAELVRVIDDYINEIGEKPINEKQKIKLYEKQVMFKELLDQLMSQLPRAFVDLDLWFKTVRHTNDFDVKLSEDNFNDEMSLVNKKKRVINNTLTKEQILDYMSLNSIHDVYARGLMDNVL